MLVALVHNFSGAVVAIYTSSSGRTILSGLSMIILFNAENLFSEMWSVQSLDNKYDVSTRHFWLILLGYLITTAGTLWFFDLWLPIPTRFTRCRKSKAGNFKGVTEESELTGGEKGEGEESSKRRLELVKPVEEGE